MSSPAEPVRPAVVGTLPAGVLLTPLRRVPHPLGDIVHGMRRGDAGWQPLGEAYFTHILPRQTKGWKQHREMVLNLLVASGEVVFHLHDAHSGLAAGVRISPLQPARLTVPPGIWVAFSGASDEAGLVLNLASRPHDPQESVNRPLADFSCVGLPWAQALEAQADAPAGAPA